MPYSIRLIPGLRSSTRRAVAFLENLEEHLDAKNVFESFDDNKKRLLKSRFDHWISGGTADNWFHGWPNDKKYKGCFTFKWKENRQHNRLYGFLCNPKPIDDPGFQLCVMAFHSRKKEKASNPADLDRAIQLFRTPEVIAAALALYRAPNWR